MPLCHRRIPTTTVQLKTFVHSHTAPRTVLQQTFDQSLRWTLSDLSGCPIHHLLLPLRPVFRHPQIRAASPRQIRVARQSVKNQIVSLSLYFSIEI